MLNTNIFEETEEREILTFEEELVLEKIKEYANKRVLLENLPIICNTSAYQKLIARTESGGEIVKKVDTEIIRYFVYKREQERIIRYWKEDESNKEIGVEGNTALEWVNGTEEFFANLCMNVLDIYKSPRLLGILLHVFYTSNVEALKNLRRQ